MNDHQAPPTKTRRPRPRPTALEIRSSLPPDLAKEFIQSADDDLRTQAQQIRYLIALGLETRGMGIRLMRRS